MVNAFTIEKALLIGVPSIDKDHHRLLQLLDRLVQDPRADSASVTFTDVLSQLGSQIAAHFESEETFLRSCDMPSGEVAEHVSAHDAILEQYAVLNMAVMQGEHFSKSEVLRSVKSWLVGHLVRYDLDMRKYLQDVSVSTR